ncbi:MAG TPA: porin [Candidatus Acidoferrum sp.]|nr:porin [Candidatus Acidoferrum sp.]
MLKSLAFTAALFFTAGLARAQAPPPPTEAEQIQALLDRVAALEKEVAGLKAAQVAVATAPASVAPAPTVAPANNVVASSISPSPAKPTPTAPLPAQPAQLHDHDGQVPQEAMQQLETHYPSLQIRGFADADFSATDQKGTTSGFSLGQFDLHIASALSQKISYFAEITVNAHPTDYTIEMERSFIRYDYNDHFKISFGRFHTPIGYWNTTFHHGAWLQTSIDRPFLLKVGGTFTPVHFVGALAEGTIPSGGLGLNYNVGIGNGRGAVITRPGDAGDVNNNRAWVAKIFARPAKLYGLEFGGSVYRDKISVPASAGFREWISNAYLVWTKGAPEFLAEFDNVNHQNIATNAVSNSDAMYAQFAYRLPWFEHSVKPYYRFEYTHMPLSEQVFAYQPQLESTFGLRYDISNFAAFKAEYRFLASHPALGPNPALPSINGLFFQTDFTF